MPTTGDESFENAMLGCIEIEVKWLRIKGTGEFDNHPFGDMNGTRPEPVADVEVLQVEFSHVPDALERRGALPGTKLFQVIRQPLVLNWSLLFLNRMLNVGRDP